MHLPVLRADCARCASLCCVGLAFDRSELFAFDKPAGLPCHLLGDDNRCTIHDSLAERGQAGCANYECLGAGQHVVQHLFGGRSWRTDPALEKPMFEAFRIMRQVHELLALLERARQLPLDEAQALAIEGFLERLLPSQGWTLELLDAFDRSDLEAEIRAFLPSLREIAIASARENRDLPAAPGRTAGQAA